MFTSSLRRQSPALLRLTASSIRVLASSPSPKPVILHSAPSKTAVLTSSAAQQRFFAVSTYLHEANAATQEFVDSDPPAGEYHYAGHGEDHHFGDNEPVTKFQQLADRGIVDEAIINTITKGMGYEEMTKVQRKTIMETVNGDNVLAQAKTGTGKTIAFLLPVLQRILTAEKPLVTPSRSGFRSKDRTSSYADIRAIIVSPTRELATQIAVDARKLSSGTNIIVQTAVGGTGKREGLRDIHKYGCHILIATPGRLLDLLTDQEGVRAPNLEIFVMDEADNLLDVGFANELDNIMAALPRRDQPIGNSGRGRQTLLFSATVPDKVMNVVMKTMGKDYKVLRMVEKGEASTHERVEQHLIRCNALENLVPATYELILREIAAINAAYEEGAEKLPFKAIVFFSATRWASLAAETFRNLRGSSEPGPDGQTGHHPLYPTKVFEIHSRLTQGQRDTAATRFRNAESAILFSSDVTARGMDFPKVTHVIQVGGPRNHEQYIHRLGRTARGTAGGVGYIIIPEIEAAQVLRELKGLPLVQDDSITTSHLDLGAEQNLPKKTADAITSITEASMRVPRELKAKTYSALIGLYSAIGNKHLMVAALNRLATLGWGMEKPPYVSPLLARKMGLDRVPGLNMARGEDDFTSEGDQGGFRSGGFHGGRGGFGGGSRGSSRPWEGRGSQNRGSFGDRGDRPSRGGFGGPSRGGYSRDGDSGGHSDFGGRPSYGDRESSGGRGGFGGSRGRGGFGGRGGFSSGGDSGGRSSFGNRPSYGDRESSGGRGGFGGSRGRGGFSRGGSSGGFERRGDKQSDGGYRGGAGYGGRTSSHSYEGDNFGGHNKSDRNTSSSYQNSERGNYNKKVARSSFEHPLSKSNQNSESSFNGPRTGRGAPRGMSRFDD